jgi:arylsulfatase A
VLPVLRCESGRTITKRCWQWNRYMPVCDCNAAIRDGDWKLVRPWRDRCGDVPDNQWNHISVYGPEHFIHNGIFQPPYPTVQLGPTQPPLLFNIRNDPYERNDLATADPDRVARLGRELDHWFEDVEHDRRSITDSVPPPRTPRPWSGT